MISIEEDNNRVLENNTIVVQLKPLFITYTKTLICL